MAWSSRHPIITLLVIGCICVGAIVPASRVRIATSVDSLMIENDPDKAYYLETRDLFGSEAMALVYVEDPALFTPEKLDVFERLIHDLDSIEGIVSTESLLTVTEIENRDGQLDIRPLLGNIPDSGEKASRLRENARQHSVIRHLLLSEQGDATVVQMRIDTDNGHADNMRSLYTAIEKALEPYAGQFHRVEQLGRPYIIAQETEYIIRDQRHVLPLAVVALVVMLVLLLRSFKGAVLPLLTSGVSILWTLAFMGIFDLPVTVLTFMVPSLIIVIGSTEDIHLLSEFRAARLDGLPRRQAVHRMILRLSAAVVFTAATTFTGFATIAASPIPVLRNFGLVASFGLLANPLVTITLIPACLALFPDRGKQLPERRILGRIEKYVLKKLAAYRRRPYTTLLAVCLPCLLAGVWGACHVKADNNIIGFFRPDTPVVQRVNRLANNLCGAETFCIRLDAESPGAFKEPANLRYAIQLQNHLRDAGWSDRSVSLTDYLSYIHANFQPSGTALPDSKQGIAEYLLLLHHSEIEPYATPDFQHLNIVVRHNLRSSRELRPRIKELEQYIAQTKPDHLQVGVTGEMLLVNKAVREIVKGQLRSVLTIALIATLLMSILFRSLRIGCIGLVPNLLPIGIQFGIMAILDIPLNTATSMAAAISIGLAVDDTIHLLMRFYSQDRSLPPEEAVDRSVQHLLRPVTVTTLSLILGFMVMRLSHFMPIADFTFLSTIVLASALIADLVVTPTLLSLPIMHPPNRNPTSRNGNSNP